MLKCYFVVQYFACVALIWGLECVGVSLVAFDFCFDIVEFGLVGMDNVCFMNYRLGWYLL